MVSEAFDSSERSKAEVAHTTMVTDEPRCCAVKPW